jgi:TonB family protein
LEPLPEPVDSAAERFRRAESLWTADSLPQAAIREYLTVSQLYSDTDWGPKALFAAAWIQENILEDIPAALASYDSLIAWFPESPYIDVARKKVAPPPPEVLDTTEVLEDTTAVVQLAGALEPAPPGSGPPELIGGEEVLQNYIHQNHREAGIPGEVMVNFTVDAQGNPHSFNILREDPEGFDFGQMAIQALQGVTFRPGYRDGQYIEAPSTQIVRFIP